MMKFESLKIQFLDNPAISGSGECNILNLGIKMSKTPKYGLWEMIGFWIFLVLTDKAVIWGFQ